MSWLSWIFFGALAGWVASLVLRDKQRGCLTNMVTGILGAVLAGFIYRWVTGVPWNFGWDWQSFGVACLGALGLLLVINLVTRGSQFEVLARPGRCYCWAAVGSSGARRDLARRTAASTTDCATAETLMCSA